MKNPYEVLSQKEIDISRLRKEIAALRMVIQLVDGDDDDGNSAGAEFGAVTDTGA